MNTPAHLLLGAAAFGKADSNKITIAAVIGAMIPDLSLYVMGAVALFVMGISPDVVFGDLYFSDAWQQVFAIDNSSFVWGGAFALAWWFGAKNAMVFAGAALMHLAFDFPLHHDDGRPHFWPVSNWVFESPVSYWDRSAHAGLIGPVEMALGALFCVILMRHYRAKLAKFQGERGANC